MNPVSKRKAVLSLVALFLIVVGVFAWVQSLNRSKPKPTKLPFTNIVVDTGLLHSLSQRNNAEVIKVLCHSGNLRVVTLGKERTPCQEADDAERFAPFADTGNRHLPMQGRLLVPFEDCDPAKPRPHCAQAVILLKSDHGRFDLMHEYLHWLIYQERMKAMAASGKKDADLQKAILEQRCPTFEKANAESENLRNSWCIVNYWAEELDIDRYLIDHANELGIPAEEVKSYSLKTDFEHDNLKNLLEIGYAGVIEFSNRQAEVLKEIQAGRTPNMPKRLETPAFEKLRNSFQAALDERMEWRQKRNGAPK